MAVKLVELYKEIEPLYDVRLVTKSCFGKVIEWTHIIENPAFIKLLHGGELIFSAGIQYSSVEWMIDFVERLMEADAGGLIVTFPDGDEFPQEVIDFCNEKEFPIFSAQWDTSYMEIMRLFAEILLKNEQRDTNLVSALRNAIYYPENEDTYLNHFEHHGFYRNMKYVMAVLSCNSYRTSEGNKRLKQIARSIQYSGYKQVTLEEEDRLIIMFVESGEGSVKEEFQKLCDSDRKVYAGLGTEVFRLQDLKESYEHAFSAYQLTKSAISTNFLVYDQLGVYKVLLDMKHPEIGEIFIKEVLGELISYDEMNETDYMEILLAFFEHDCSILHTAEAIYCHKNTLNYKMNKIKEILGYDIMTNENRTRIMVAFYFMKMRV